VRAARGETAADPDARVSASEEDTEALGAGLAAGLEAGDVIVLIGPLGAGKTRFVSGLARGLGAGSRVRSPSFPLINEYRGARLLLHLDLYRIEPREVEGLGLEEQIERGVLVAEWGEKLPPALRREALTLRFEILSETGRTITGRAAGPRGLALLERWRALEPPLARGA
jgi:tRNA threonylcarbamoyladenosine biosynthesis protein TsaE